MNELAIILQREVIQIKNIRKGRKSCLKNQYSFTAKDASLSLRSLRFIKFN